MKNEWSEETEILLSGRDLNGLELHPDSPAIHPATAYVLRDTEHYGQAKISGGYIYSRTANPNRDELSDVISRMERGEATIIHSSGMAAVSNVLLAFSRAGGHILANNSIYGETVEVLEHILPRFGVEVSYADFTNPTAVEKAVRPGTSMLYSEIIANPLLTVIDPGAISAIAKQAGALFVVDSTFTTPFMIKPLEYGADIVIHSLTKFFGGHSDLTAGSVTCSAELMKRLRPEQRLLGGVCDPYTAWLALRSIKTMGLRIEKHIRNAETLAEFLLQDGRVRQVNYPGLTTHPQHELAKQLFPKGCGPMISFLVEDDLDKVNAFMRKLRLVEYLGTLGGCRTSIAHPATSFRAEFSTEELIRRGMREGLIRVSTGLENVHDLIADFSNALSVFD